VDFYSQLNCCLTAWSGAFCFQWDGFAGIVLNISFFDATEEGGHSLSTEKFAVKGAPGRKCVQ